MKPQYLTDDIKIPSWLPYILFAGLSGILAFPILSNLDNWGIRDWDLFTTLHAAAVKSVIEYGQFPFWNPYIGGGNILFAHPEVSVLHPYFILLLVFGTVIGLKLQLLLSYYIGFIGCYKLSRKLNISYVGSYIPPIIFMLSSYFALHFSAGHLPFHYFSVLPWLFLFYEKSKENGIHILSIGGAVAFMILGSGGAVPLLFSLFFLFLYSLFDINRKDKIRYPLYAIGGGLCGILFAAVKFLPMVDYLSRNPWLPPEIKDVIPAEILFKMLFSFDQWLYGIYDSQLAWEWHEYGAFIGPVGFLLILTAVVFKFKLGRRYVVLGLIGLILALGSFVSSWSPWDLLHKFPGFESMRVPSRLILLTLFSFSLLAGVGTDYLLSYFKRGKTIAVTIVFVALTATHLLVVMPILNNTFVRQPVKPEQNFDFRQIEGNPNQMYAALLSNRGTIRAAWVSAYKGGRGIFDGQKLHEYYSENNAVEVISREFSPNRILFRISSPSGGQLVVGQGYDRSWRRADNEKIDEFNSLISLKIVPGQHQVEVYNRPDYFYLGLAITIISILAGVYLAWKFGFRVKTDNEPASILP